MNLNITDVEIFQLSERIKNLEDLVVKKNKKAEATRAQKMLLLKHTGILEIIIGFKIQKQYKAKFLSVLLNCDETNLENDLSFIMNDNPKLRNKKDYEFLIKTFDELGMADKKKEVEEFSKKIPTK
ncbi:MAG: hypothetical protein JWR61_395 [Ferruginibacter sp.]|uniref:hypothetical protein n=1 Tax=Ferruginibacter sp. TaxID=1940288 RepID=UPI00265821FB|nr:hypothetical protein [Ferruginibacter sp.]MDB5275440.1 hypothetical protein [Ferruginibacter sp.]